MRIGVDVGGTNTDAVLMDGRDVVASVKAPTTEDVGGGIIQAVSDVLDRSGIHKGAIQHIMIGTTQFTNAIVERARLLEVAVIRLALPATDSLLPLVDWPRDLVDAVGRHVYMVRGGYEFDGRQISALDEDELVAVAWDIKTKGICSVAISSVFAPLNSAMEKRASEIIRGKLPDLDITCSHEIGRVGLIERENATVMNAALVSLSHKVVGAFRDALEKLAIEAPCYISQNDGTLMSAEYAERYPVMTFGSGPTNSMRGASFLSQQKDAIVVDIGGTTTDVGYLSQGFPRESAVAVDVGGVRTNFRMPDILAIGLGGGSRIRHDTHIRIGPDSVGYELNKRALVFGGETITATDIAVAAGATKIGNSANLSVLDANLISRSMDKIHLMLEDVIDRMKISAMDVPVILVGGGSVLVNRELRGAAELHVPEHFNVANAIGAAIAQVGGEIDRVFSYEAQGRETSLDMAKDEARKRATMAGADEATVEIVEVEEIPLAYMPGGAVRLRVKAVGDLAAV